MTDPRKAKTLGEACDNGDGTYNGIHLLSWLSEVVAPGKGLSVNEVRKIADEVKAKRVVADYSGMEPRQNPRQPIFRDHDCPRCNHGERACVEGNYARCSWLHARND